MATPKRAFTSKSSVATSPRFVSKAEADDLEQALRVGIADRAYQLYEASGYAPGHDREHWLQAESEVFRQELEVRESGSWMAVSGSLPEVAAQDLEIYIEARRVIIRGKTQAVEGSSKSASTDAFWGTDLEKEVEPATATAALKDGKLTLMVKKRSPSPIQPIQFADGQ